MKKQIQLTPKMIRDTVYHCLADGGCKGCGSGCPIYNGGITPTCTSVICFTDYPAWSADALVKAKNKEQLIKEIIEDKCDGLYVDLLKLKELTDDENIVRSYNKTDRDDPQDR